MAKRASTKKRPILTRMGEGKLVKDCMICHREVVLGAAKDSRLPMPPDGSTLPSGCEDYKKNFLRTGVALVNPKTGSLLILMDDAFKMIFNKSIPPGKVACVVQKKVDECLYVDSGRTRRVGHVERRD